MKETDELRRVAAKTECANGRCEKLYRGDLERIADRIDEEHQKAMREEYQRGVNDGYDMGFASADDWLAQHEDAMAEHGWIRLPVDADGVPIRIGDVMELTNGLTVEVVGIGKGSVLFYTDEPGGQIGWTYAKKLHHRHEPTVEDVLREFAEAMNENMGMYTGEAIDADEWRDADRQTIAEYAAKLRLAEKNEDACD